MERFTPGWMTAVAFASIGIPFLVVIVRLLLASDHNITLNSDLALLDLHTRDALRWQQLLGPFDRFGWSHPGPTYYYLLTIPYRVLGSGPKALFVGAALINALAAAATVWVVRRRGGPVHALWAAACLGVLAFQLSPGGVANTTQSEGPLGIVLSPWNPCIVVFPLVLFVVLCAAAPNRSPLSLVGALLVGSFVVQTNISTAVIVIVVFAVAAVATVVLGVHRRRVEGAAGGLGVESAGAVGEIGRRWWAPVHRRGVAWGIVGTAALAAMWVPPLIQQVQDQPGNLTAIYRFFTTPQPGGTPDLHHALWAVFEVDNMLGVGPTGPHAVIGGNPVWTGVMTFVIGSPPPTHRAAAWATVIVVLLAAVVAVVLGFRLRRWFPMVLGGLSLVGGLAAIWSATQVVGALYGYLLSWEVAVPTAGVIAVGGLWAQVGRRSPAPGWRLVRSSAAARGDAGGTSGGGSVRTGKAGPSVAELAVRVGLAVLALVVAVVLSVRFMDLPPLSAASDPKVGEVVRLVEPHLDPGQTVYVNWSSRNLFGIGTFLGVVVDLDNQGYQPKANHLWKAQFGSCLVSGTKGLTAVELSPWIRSSPSKPGYLARVGNIAVQVLPVSG